MRVNSCAYKIKEDRKKRLVDCFHTGPIEEVIGPIERNCDVFGLTGGQFSLIDLIFYCLKTTGPADLLLSTWTASGANIDLAYRLLSDKYIK